jgi:hypothetical protein
LAARDFLKKCEMRADLQLVTTPPKAYYLGDDLLTAAEVVAWLKTTRSWLKEQTRERTRKRSKNPFPRSKSGKELRFSKMRIAEWLAENES